MRNLNERQYFGAGGLMARLDCNEMRCMANEIMARMLTAEFSTEDKIIQFELLAAYASAAIKTLTLMQAPSPDSAKEE